MQYGGWQRQPAPGQRVDPLAAGAGIPSWPDQAPPGGPPRLSLSGDDALAGAWPELPGLPQVGLAEEKPALGARILLPIAAALMVIAGLLLVPWTVSGDAYPAVASLLSERELTSFSSWYAVYLAGPLGLFAVLVSFAAATGFRPLQWAQLGVAVTTLGAIWLLTGSESGFRPTLIVVTAVGLVWASVIGFARRLALRISAAGFLAACAATHVGALAFSGSESLAGSAYLAALGYLIGAAGAVIGPRYVSVHRPL